MSIKWIIFDAMGVIFETADDVSDSLIPFLRSKSNDLSTKAIFENYYLASLGKKTSLEFWTDLGHANEFPEIEIEYLDKWYRIDPEFIEIAEKLKKKYKMAMLSNDLKHWSNFLRNKYNLNRYFEFAIISGDVGYRKPTKKIYKILLNKTKCLPEECIFLDDHLENLQSAAELGIKTINFVKQTGKIAFCSEFEIISFKELIHVIEKFY